jgi:hypothetical protein
MTGIAIGLVLSATATLAHAEGGEFGSARQFVVGVERAFGVYGYKLTDHWVDAGPGNNAGTWEDSYSGTSWNLLWGRSGDVLQSDPLVIPRVGFDYFVAEHWSVGGSLGYMSSSGEQKNETRPPGHQLTRSDLPDISIFAFAPRAGFAYMFGKVVGIWPRAGITYLGANVDSYTAGNRFETSIHLWNVNVEGLLVITPLEHVAITVGPVIDIGLTGSSKTSRTPAPTVPDPEHDVTLHNYGVAAGLLMYF